MRPTKAYYFLFVGLAFGMGIYFSLKSWQVYKAQKNKADYWEKELDHAEKERIELLKKKAFYESPVGREELARERGYKKSNELALDPAK